MMAIESAAIAFKVVTDKKATKQKRRNERLVEELFLQKTFFIQMVFWSESLRYGELEFLKSRFILNAAQIFLYFLIANYKNIAKNFDYNIIAAY